MTIKRLHHGDLFVLKNIQDAKPGQVWIKKEYSHKTRRYKAVNLADSGRVRWFKSDREIFVDFIY